MKPNFKDQLIRNKWQLYQDKLSESLINQYDIDKNNLLTKRNEICPEGVFESKIREEYIKVYLRFHDKHKFHNKEFNCSQYHCMKSAL